MTIDDLVNKLTDPVAFAEEHCEWYSDDYYLECEEEDGDWYPIDGSDHSVNDAALDAIREWAALSDENLNTLREATLHE